MPITAELRIVGDHAEETTASTYSGRDLDEVKADYVKALRAEAAKGDEGVNFDIIVVDGVKEKESIKSTSSVPSAPKVPAAPEVPSRPASQQGEATLSEKPYTSTAAKLMKAIKADALPTDPLTRQQFGFSKVVTVEDEKELSALYHGLQVDASTLQDWQKQNKLATGIYHTYTRQKIETHAFEWFRKH